VRARVLEAATRLLAERGFDGMTLQAVADAVGVRKPSVLHHFESKEALREGVIADILGHWGRLVPQLLRSVSGAENSFGELMRELTGFFTEDPNRARLLIREVLDRPQEFRGIYVAHVRPWLEMFGAGIRDGQRRGIYRSDVDAEQYLTHMLQLIVITIGQGEVLADPAATPRDVAQRSHRELLRITRTALFNDENAPRLGKGARGRR
jgi:AcrR family transcriptional regulator